MAPPSTPDRYPPRQATAFDDIAEVKVGSAPHTTCFRLHKGLLSFYSGYFAKALNGSFVESRTGAITMTTEDPETFKLFQYWLYNRQFYSDKAHEVENTLWSTIIKLWIFGDAHEIPLLQNAALDLFREKIVQKWLVPTSEIRNIYNNTLPGSLLRKFMVEVTAYTGYATVTLAPGTEDWWIHEALCDLLKVLWVPQPINYSKEDLQKMDMCKYHVHEEGVRCTHTRTS
ncbi:hypothetical protein LTR37_017854 [Vermiconidia calcicola]|uniref:Uncharacterized protein n=1 Tax=Vermiconidia calcicola TaxID=1690605 RepID=A0ACC3MLI4_9PEZI|nr:hypothetical protein LTR37_017854 [Vermiconidia calcicola]